jgi:hypothetical protein
MEELPSDSKDSKLFPFMIFEVLSSNNSKEVNLNLKKKKSKNYKLI